MTCLAQVAQHGPRIALVQERRGVMPRALNCKQRVARLLSRRAAQGEEQLELEVFGRGGHASMPPRHGSVRCALMSSGLHRVFSA